MVFAGEGNGTPLRYSCLENPMDGGAWWAAIHGVAKSQTRLSVFTFTFHFHALEKEMATHSSVLAFRIPGTGEPSGLPSVGSHRVGHDWSDLAAAGFLTVFWFLSPETSDSIYILNCSILSPLLQYFWTFYFLGRSGSGVTPSNLWGCLSLPRFITEERIQVGFFTAAVLSI